LASGINPDLDIFTVTATTSLTNITGIRLETLPHESLPQNRPGRQQDSGNFTLSEFTVAIEPQVVIKRHPKSQVGYWGKNIDFDVLVEGGQSWSYQWQKDGQFIPGANDAILTLTNLQMTAGGNYSVIVGNFSGSVTSNPAILTVNPAGVSVALYAGVSIDGVVGFTYGIQASTNLNEVNGWRGVANVTLDAPLRIWFDTQPATQERRFYRVVPGPIPIP
jgi:hypothetical protein